MTEEYKEIELNGVKLRVFSDGTIVKYTHTSSRGNVMEWRVQQFKQKCSYYRICLNKKMYLVHRIIAMAYRALDIEDLTHHVDHIDQCKTNNNITNLRVVTPTENMWNLSPKKGYHKKASNKYCSQIKINNKTTHIGIYDNEQDAHNAYLEAKEKYHQINPHHHLR